MTRLPLVMQVGGRISIAIGQLFDRQPELVERILGHVGKPHCTALPGEINDLFTSTLSEALSHVCPAPPHVVSPEKSPVNVDLLDHWRTAAKEPDAAPVTWLRFGAPAGIIHEVPDNGIFPTYSPEEDTAEIGAEDLRTEEGFTNYSGVESDQDARLELKRLVEAKFAMRFKSIAEAEAFLGAAIVLSKIGMIKKLRNGKMKIRMVVDSKQSGVSRATRKFERTLLPRALDIVQDAMTLMLNQQDGDQLEFLIADFRDAFFILPNTAAERRFFAVMFRGEVYVFLRTTQGSRGAPLTWARLAALVTRLTQSVIGLESTRISTYVDDPIVLAMGPKEFRRRTFATVLALWSALRLPLAFDKAVLNPTVTWTSAVFSPTATGITVRVKDAIVKDTTEMLRQFLGGNYIAKKPLRSCIGKAMHIASLIPSVRPFITDLYGALYKDAFEKHVWTKQVIHALTWILVLLMEEDMKLERTFELSAFMGQGVKVELCLDASPWGLGGFLTEDGVPIAWFAAPLGSYEKELLSIKEADCSAQQTVEALAVLVALRTWKSRWQDRRVLIKVKSDSMSALILTFKMKSAGIGAGIVARELALDIAMAHYRPHVCEHIPGVDNVVADALSRKYMPGITFAVPAFLCAATEVVLPSRDADYFRTADPPSLAAIHGIKRQRICREKKVRSS